MSDNHQTVSDARLDAHIDALRDDHDPAGPSPAALTITLAMLRSAGSEPIPIPIYKRLFPMTFTQRIAAAVMLTIGGLALYLMLAMLGGSSVAFADVAAKVGSTRTLTFTSTLTIRGKAPVESKIFLAEPDHARIETANGNVIVHNGHTTLTLNAKDRTADRTTSADDEPDGLLDFIGIFRELAKSNDAKKLGGRTIDGVRVQGFEAAYEKRKMTVWADAKTADPVRVETTRTTPRGKTTTVIEHFQIDPVLDDANFSVEAPAGYKLTEHNE